MAAATAVSAQDCADALAALARASAARAVPDEHRGRAVDRECAARHRRCARHGRQPRGGRAFRGDRRGSADQPRHAVCRHGGGDGARGRRPQPRPAPRGCWIRSPPARSPGAPGSPATCWRKGPTVLRGNASEVMALTGGSGGKGVESVDTPEAALAAARGTGRHARHGGCRQRPRRPPHRRRPGGQVSNGHPLLTRVTGVGCALGAMMAGFAAVVDDPLVAAVAATAALTVCGDRAAFDVPGSRIVRRCAARQAGLVDPGGPGGERQAELRSG